MAVSAPGSVRACAIVCFGLMVVVSSGGAARAGESRERTDADFSVGRIASLRQMLEPAGIRTRVEAMYDLAEIGPEARDAIPRLIELLSDDTVPLDPADQLLIGVPQVGRDSLCRFGPHVGAPLTAALPLQSSDARRRSYQVLARLGHVGRESLDWLVSEFRNPRAPDREMLLAAIAMVDPRGDVAISLLIDGLADTDRTVRLAAAAGLDRSGSELPSFAKALRDNGAARWMAQESGQSREREIVTALLQALEDADPEVRAVTIRSLVTYRTFSSEIVPALLNRLSDTEQYSFMISSHSRGSAPVGAEAAQGLAEFPELADRTVPELFKAASDPGRPAYWAAGNAVVSLCEHVPGFLPTIMSALDDDPDVSILAAVARNGPRAAAAESRLSGLMRSDDSGLQPLAAAALVCVDSGRNRDAMRIVADALRDEESREYVCDFIAQAGPHAAPLVPALLEHVVDAEIKNWLNWDVTGAIEAIGPAAIEAAPLLIARLDTDLSTSFAVDALFAIGPGVHPLLANTLQNGQHSAEHNRIVLELLARSGPDAASTVPSIISHVTGNYPRVREAAARALGAIGAYPELSLPALGRALGDPRPFVRAAAAESLAAFPDRASETVPQLVNALGDEYLDVRLAAATALGLLGREAQSALPALRELVQDPNVLINETARESIDRIMKP